MLSEERRVMALDDPYVKILNIGESEDVSGRLQETITRLERVGFRPLETPIGDYSDYDSDSENDFDEILDTSDMDALVERLRRDPRWNANVR
jgi:hypothetical protein